MTATSEPDRLLAEQQALEDCENEPLDVVGMIQPFGALLATDTGLETVTHVSTNIENVVGRSVEDVLGASLNAVLPVDVIHALRNSAGHSTIHTQREYIGAFTAGDHEVDVSVHLTATAAIIELQLPEHAGKDASETLADMPRLVQRLAQCDTVDQVLFLMVHELRALTGYDRVKAYQFLPGGAGSIVAESRSAHVDSFLGLRFPAFDIPQSARRLYAETPLRIIFDVDPQQPELRAVPGAEPLDLSLAVLRGAVAPHLMYLQNMGVKSTLSIPIVVDGEMWGLFAHHHYEVRAPSSTLGLAAELLGRTVSMTIQQIIDRRRASGMERCADIAATMPPIGEGPVGIGSYWEDYASALATLMPCHGVALVSETGVHTYGACPDDATVTELASLTSDQPTVAINGLAEHLNRSVPGGTAGALVVGIPSPGYRALLYFRDEVAQSVRWAGESHFKSTGDGLRLEPRASFAEYLETASNRCDPWTADELDLGRALHEALDRIHAGNEFRESQRERLGLMVRELNHRVRNILALIQSLVASSANQESSIEDYAQAVEQRIVALARAHDLLTEQEWESPRLDELVSQALIGFGGVEQNQITWSGPDVSLRADTASVLALTLHELASNASKYGALSVTEGRVELNWERSGDSMVLTWVERNGPTVTEPTRAGFGSTVIRHALSYEFDALTEYHFDAEGVRCQYILPAGLFGRPISTAGASTHIEVDPAIDLRSIPQKVDRFIASTDDYRVLIVEDDFVIARQMAARVKLLLGTEADTAPSVSSTHAALDTNPYDLVLLDLNLRGEFSGVLAQRLHDDAIPFILMTGYGSRDHDLDDLNPAAVLMKPVSEEALAAALQDKGLLVRD